MNKKIIVVISVILPLLLGSLILLYPKEQGRNELDAFARCLSEKGIVMYGAEWCQYCQAEKKEFGDSFRLVSYVECPKNPKECLAKSINVYPTWIFPDGKKLVGEQGLQKLSGESECQLPILSQNQ